MSLLSDAYAIALGMSEYEPGRVTLVDRSLVMGTNVEPKAALVITPGQGDNVNQRIAAGAGAGMYRLLIESWFPMDAEPDWPDRFIAHQDALRAAFNSVTLGHANARVPRVVYEPPSAANSKTSGTNLIRSAIRVERYQNS